MIYNPGPTCPNCGWPQDQTLSRIDVAPAPAEVAEGNAAPGGTITFSATRTGPADKACRVAATLSGTAGVADFAEGTAMNGIAAWEAGDSEPRSVTLALNPDRLVEGDEEVTVTLSDPVDCTIGTATVTTRITNDDATTPTAPSSYDGNLPYGGQGLGVAILLGQPGNQQVTSSSTMMFPCERDGQIDRFSWNSRFDGHGRTGYSTGDGGVISWTLSIADSVTTRPIDPGKILGTTRKITDPIKPSSWAEEWKAAGGTGPVDNYFAEMPTIRFTKPVAVKVGQMLVLTQVQHASAKGTVSINNCYSTCRNVDDWSPARLQKSIRQFKGSSLSTIRPEHFPIFLVGYTDGVVKGTGCCGDSRGQTIDQEGLLLGGSTRVRQCITVPDWADGRVVRQVVSWWGRYNATSDGSLRCRLKAAGSDPMGAADQGETLAIAQLAAGSLPYRPKNSAKMGGDPTKLTRFVFDALPRSLKAGEVIYVELTGTGAARFIGFRMVEWTSYAPVGLRRADWAMKGMGGQRDTGAGWKSLNMGSIKHHAPVWLQF